MKRIAVSILVLAIACVSADAQSLLKNIGGKVMDKVEKKVENKAGEKVDKALGKIFGEDPQQNASQAAKTNDYRGYSSAGSNYAAELLDPNYHKDYFPAATAKSSLTFNSYKDALKARLDLPEPGSLNNEKDLEAYAAKVAEVRQATEDICIKYTQQQTALNSQSVNGPYARAQEGTQNRMDQIAGELAGIYEGRALSAVNNMSNAMTSLGSALLGGKSAVDETTLSGALFTLSKRIASTWAKSDECKAVNKLEHEQGFKSREKQNEIIDKWNSRQLDIWVAKIAKFIDVEYADALKVAELDAELDAMSAADKKTANWATAKVQAVNLANLIITTMSIPACVFDCPLVSHTNTEPVE